MQPCFNNHLSQFSHFTKRENGVRSFRGHPICVKAEVSGANTPRAGAAWALCPTTPSCLPLLCPEPRAAPLSHHIPLLALKTPVLKEPVHPGGSKDPCSQLKGRRSQQAFTEVRHGSATRDSDNGYPQGITERKPPAFPGGQRPLLPLGSKGTRRQLALSPPWLLESRIFPQQQ